MNKTLIFLCSGGGGNLRFIHAAIKHGWLSRWTNIAIIADRECPAISYANENGLFNFIIDFKEPEQVALKRLMLPLKPDLIITTVHRILYKPFLETFEKKLVNLHYSLLPAFSGSIGVTPVQNALNYGSRLIGATVHSVTEVVDGGLPQVQIAVPIKRKDLIEDAMDLTFRAGCFALLTALKIAEQPDLALSEAGSVVIKNRLGLINPYSEYPEELNNENFWRALKS